MSDTAQIIVNGQTIDLPIVVGTEDEVAIDIGKLRAESGVITLDYGFKNTGSTSSAITFLDGEKGILRYRGYPIEQLAEKSNFLEVAYLLIFGELPSKDTFNSFDSILKEKSNVHEDIRNILLHFPSSSHPMGVLSALVTAQTAFYPQSLDSHRTAESVNETIYRLIAKLPTMASWVYRKSLGLPVNYPNKDLDYTSSFLEMMFRLPNSDYEVDPVVAAALDKLLILHADHEQNCSTATVRIVGSSQASLYSSIASGISALWGPLHGGANEAVIKMLENIRNDGGSIDKWINKAKDKEDSFRLMGFGHRVYKNFDPRARIIKKAADDVLDKLGVVDPVLDIAKKLEEVALNDEYFVERKLYPNVDFYSGIIYKAMGFPTQMFTVLFALGRLPGWIAQWKEMRETNQPIGRPRQIYTGENYRHFQNMATR